MVSKETVVLTICDLIEQFLYSGAPEGGGPQHHLVQDDPHRPPVHSESVALTQDHLRGNVVGCTVHFSIFELTISGPRILDHMSRV